MPNAHPHWDLAEHFADFFVDEIMKSRMNLTNIHLMNLYTEIA